MSMVRKILIKVIIKTIEEGEKKMTMDALLLL